MRNTNAYHRREWRALVRAVRKRSGGTCEARIRCNGAPVVGDPHHVEYAPFRGWKRLIVPLDKLIDCCRECHLHFEEQKAKGTPVPSGIPFLEME